MVRRSLSAVTSLTSLVSLFVLFVWFKLLSSCWWSIRDYDDDDASLCLLHAVALWSSPGKQVSELRERERDKNPS